MRKWIMNMLFGLPGFLIAGSAVTPDGGDYELTIIEEVQVPLTDGIQKSNELYFYTFLLLFFFLLIAVLTTYVVSCYRLRRRIQQLEESIQQSKSEQGWNLNRLKEMLASLENQMVEKCG